MPQKKFENKVEVIKYKVLRELARAIWEDHDPFTVFNDIAGSVIKKGEPPMSCCIYKDRAREIAEGPAEKEAALAEAASPSQEVSQVVRRPAIPCPVSDSAVPLP